MSVAFCSGFSPSRKNELQGVTCGVCHQVQKSLQVSLLSLKTEASFDEVYKCYRQLAKRHHPDTGGDPQQFMHINAAYDCVKKWLQSHG